MDVMENLQNWARNLTYHAQRVHRPASVEEVAEIVVGARKIRALGTRHSFNEIADSNEDLLSTEFLNRVVSLDTEACTVTVEGGIPYGRLSRHLDEHGFAVHNLASLPHISVAGAVATATHGSGERNGNLSTAVAGLEIVKADGSTVHLKRGDADFNGAVVNLGALGVVTRVTLDLVPSFTVRQYVYDGLPLEQVEAHFDAIEASAYSVSLFTTWRQAVIDQVWLKCTDDEGPFGDSFFGATPAPENRHPLPDLS
ncbi:FAD-binding protein, partial [bacterium]